MESILMNIKPESVAKILKGEKTIEVRKTKPKCDTPFKVYIYCTKGGQQIGIPQTECREEGIFNTYINEPTRVTLGRGWFILYPLNGKVVAEFTCDNIEVIKEVGINYEVYNITQKVLDGSCLKREEINKYGKNKSLYAWHISNLKVYDEPKELHEFKRQNPCYWSKYEITDEGVDAENCWENCTDFDSRYCDGRCSKLEKAPTSWCYVEE